jgi:glyoxylase-like metal-dependent hydrolase (beta-lactamase superfamily II)
VDGNSQKLDGGAMFGNAPLALWSRWYKPDELGRIDLACRAFLVEVDGMRILLETGVGAFFAPEMAERYGVESGKHELVDSLLKVGLQPGDIDYVILSHLHFDHAGGLLGAYGATDQGKIIFEKAKIVVGRKAWDRALHPHSRDRASYLLDILEPLKRFENLVIVEDGEKFPESLDRAGFGYFLTDGHTPGQLHTVVESRDHALIFCGDLIPGVAWINPAITMGYDRFPERLIDEKNWLYGQLNLEKSIFLFTHDPQWVASEIFKDERSKMSARSQKEWLESWSLGSIKK